MPIVPECPCQVEACVGSCYEFRNFCMFCPCDVCDRVRDLHRYYVDLVYCAMKVSTFEQYPPDTSTEVFGFVRAGIDRYVCERLANPSN